MIMTTQSNILIVDDDAELCELLAEFLNNNGFHVQHCQSSLSALEHLNNNATSHAHPDALVLDIMMPEMNGLELLQAIRSQHSLPVIMLTGRGDDIDRIIGLEMGADDYIAKPCNPRELAARLRAVLRRSNPMPSSTKSVIELHGIKLDTSQRKASINGQTLNLTSAEFSTLHILMQKAGDVVSKETLTQQVLHRKLTAYDRSIDVHVSRVRQKLNKALNDKLLIQTIRGVGYQFIGDAI